MIIDDGERQSIKRLRFRGDWSDTGPNAMTTAELRAVSSSSPSTTSNTINNTVTMSSAATNSTPSSQSAHSHDARSRHLNLILSLIFRSSIREGNIDSNDNNNRDEEMTPTTVASPAVATTSASGFSLASNSSNMNIDPVPPASDRLETNRQSDANSENASNNSQGLVIQIFDDEFDSPNFYRRQTDDDDTGGGGGGGASSGGPSDEIDMLDEEDEFDSDTTNDSVFNHDSSANSTLNRRQRSRSSSSNDSRNYRQRRRIRLCRGARQRRNHETINNDECKTKEIENRLRTYKINNFKTFMGHRNSRTVVC